LHPSPSSDSAYSAYRKGFEGQIDPQKVDHRLQYLAAGSPSGSFQPDSKRYITKTGHNAKQQLNLKLIEWAIITQRFPGTDS
jgi:hypothetical protein